jgi:two-component system, cell cycle sensor histidine kinase and response regulator CckA
MEPQLRHHAYRIPSFMRPDTVERLAAGLAHDLNNLLTPILGYSEILLESLEPGKREHFQAEEIHRAAHRSSEIVRRLLAYSFAPTSSMRATSLQDIALNLERPIRAALPPDITVHVRTGIPDARVLADPLQIEQAIMILVANAGEAMPEGGTLLVEARRATPAEEASRELASAPHCEPWGLLRVSDTGIGMTEETRMHLFEPFYTTKPGVGIGLGLATVRKIARLAEGTVCVDSCPGQGTAVSIFVPGYPVQGE